MLQKPPTRYTGRMAQIHEYPVTVEWRGGRDGTGKAVAGNSGTELPLSVGPEYGGPGAGTNPEELLTAAIASCYSITFGIIAANRKIPLADIVTEALGEVEQAGMQFTYRSVTIRARITLEPSASDEEVQLAEEMAHKADLYCIITNSVRGKVDIKVEPQIVRG